MLYLGQEQIQFSKAVDPRRALRFCTTGRKTGRRETVASSNEEEEVSWRSWSQVSLQSCQLPASSAASGNVSVFVHRGAAMSKTVCDTESPGCMFGTDPEPWGACLEPCRTQVVWAIVERSDQTVQQNAHLAKAAGSLSHVLVLQGGGLHL